MTARCSFAAAAVAVLLAPGCVSTSEGGFQNGHAYYRSHAHYRVRLDDGALLPSPWTLEVGPDAPRFVERPLSVYFPFMGGAMRVPRWDLRFVRDEHGGAIWVRTLALASAWAADPLDVLLERSVLSLLTPNAAAPDLLGREVRAAGVAIRRAGPARVDGREGRYLTFDVTEHLEDDLATERVTVVAVPLDAPVRHQRWTLPAIALFGHASVPDRHAAQHADFERFVARVDLAPDRSTPAAGARPRAE